LQVETFLQSSTFAAKQAARRQQGGRGIVINAGGPHLLSTAIVTIKVGMFVTELVRAGMVSLRASENEHQRLVYWWAGLPYPSQHLHCAALPRTAQHSIAQQATPMRLPVQMTPV
jgi:hypothetical protein